MNQLESLALTGAIIVDGRGGVPLQGRAVLVRGGRIEDVRPAAHVPGTVSRCDLSGMTLLPGLIDAHVHLLGQRSMDNSQMTFVGEGLRAARVTADLGRLLEVGITVRGCGSYTRRQRAPHRSLGQLPQPRSAAARAELGDHDPHRRVLHQLHRRWIA